VIICITESRAKFEPAVRLLVMSLAKHSPAVPVYLVFPQATHNFRRWLANFQRVTLSTHRVELTGSFNVKPQAMLHLMEKGHDEVLWIDSDIVIGRDIVSLLAEVPPDTVVVTEESLWGWHDDTDAWRARGWGFEVGRVLPFALNAGVVRATRLHEPLLRRWAQLIESRKYQEVQQLDWRSRPPHMHGDSEVWTALLSSAEFAHIPLKILTRGQDIIQYFGPYGFTVWERLSCLFGQSPAFIHSLGPSKPWIREWRSVAANGIKEYLEAVYLDLSPYTLAATEYRMGLEGNASWLDVHYTLSAVLRAVGLWQCSLVGLPIAIIADLNRLIKSLLPLRLRKVNR
jgi:hypothetical protein